jgi:hypothetical protein
VTAAEDTGAGSLVRAALVRATEQINVRRMVEAQADRVRHFAARLDARGLTHRDAVIVFFHVDDKHGAVLADAAMPGYDWAALRARGGQWARGLCLRSGVQEVLESLDAEQASRLRDLDELAVVAVARGLCLVAPAREVAR